MTCRFSKPSAGSCGPHPALDRRATLASPTSSNSRPSTSEPSDSLTTMARPNKERGKTMTEREVGRSGLKVSAVGLGCMGMSDFYDPKQLNDEESVRVIHRYLDAGGNFLDTADMYGMGRNEALVGKAIAGRRDTVVLATKFGNVRGPNGEFLGVRGDPQYVRQCCDASLKRLRVEVIDLYYQHRV